MTTLKNIQSFIHKPNTNTVVYSYILTLLHCCCHCCAVWRLSHEQKTKRKSFLFWVWRCSNNNKTVEITCFHPFIIMQNCQIVILFMYCVLGDTRSSFSRVQSYFLQSDVHRHRVQLVFCKPRVIRKPGQDSVDQREWWEFIQSNKEIKQKKVHSLSSVTWLPWQWPAAWGLPTNHKAGSCESALWRGHSPWSGHRARQRVTHKSKAFKQ